MADHYLVSRGLLDRCLSSFKDKVNTEAPKRAPFIIEALAKSSATKPSSTNGTLLSIMHSPLLLTGRMLHLE